MKIRVTLVIEEPRELLAVLHREHLTYPEFTPENLVLGMVNATLQRTGDEFDSGSLYSEESFLGSTIEVIEP